VAGLPRSAHFWRNRWLPQDVVESAVGRMPPPSSSETTTWVWTVGLSFVLVITRVEIDR
jgi:hypothetical protein